MAEMSITLNLLGSRDLVNKAMEQVRGEFTTAIRNIAMKEEDPRVQARLFEVSAYIQQELSAINAVEAIAVAPSGDNKRFPKDGTEPLK